jgi:HAMP domain-containing protein
MQTLEPVEERPTPLSLDHARGGLARYLLLALLPLILGPLLTVAYLLYRQARSEISAQVLNQITVLSQIKESQIDQWAAQRAADMDNLARAPDVIETARTLVLEPTDAPSRATAQATLRQRFDNYLNNISNTDYAELLLAHADTGEVIATSTSGQGMLGKNFLSEEFFRTTRTSGPLLVPPTYQPMFNSERVTLIATAPVVDPALGASAILVGVIRNDRLLEIVAPIPGLHMSSLHASLITRDGYAFGSSVTSGLSQTTIKPDSEGIRRARDAHLDGSAQYLNAQRQPVLGAYNWLPRYELALIIEQRVDEAFAPLQQGVTTAVIVMALAVAISTLGVIFVTRRLTQPIQALTEGALRMASGDLSSQVPVERNDEIGVLSQAFNSMSTQLRELYASLESKVDARTRQLSAAAEVGRAATSILSTEELLARTAQLIRERFGYDHVSIFLLDERRAYAVLRESTGEAGTRLKARGYRVGVGSPSIIGWVTRNHKPFVASDVEDASSLYLKDERLPDTRSEAAVPLRIGDRMIGALDVQSREPNAFSAGDIEALQILADQIAVAVENGRLFTRQQRVVQMEHIVSTVTTKIYKSLTLGSILENAAVELGRAFGARRAVIRLKPSDEPAPGDQADGNGHSTETPNS